MQRSRRTRTVSGALDASARPAGTADLERRTVTALVGSVRGVQSLADATVYAAFVTAGRFGARHSDVRWERDESSRRTELAE